MRLSNIASMEVEISARNCAQTSIYRIAGQKKKKTVKRRTAFNDGSAAKMRRRKFGQEMNSLLQLAHCGPLSRSRGGRECQEEGSAAAFERKKCVFGRFCTAHHSDIELSVCREKGKVEGGICSNIGFHRLRFDPQAGPPPPSSSPPMSDIQAFKVRSLRGSARCFVVRIEYRHI